MGEGGMQFLSTCDGKNPNKNFECGKSLMTLNMIYISGVK
jgi:hypothetical protein